MNTWLLIGGIGSGKSHIMRRLREVHHLATLDLDEVGHEVLDLPDVKRNLIEAFGAEALGASPALLGAEVHDLSADVLANYQVNRVYLARKVFGSAASLARLNEITHPEIERIALEQMHHHAASGVEHFVIEVSAYRGDTPSFHTLTAHAQGIIAIVAPDDLRVARVTARGRLTADEVYARIASQPRDDERRYWADFVIENAGSTDELDEKIDECVAWMRSHGMEQ